MVQDLWRIKIVLRLIYLSNDSKNVAIKIARNKSIFSKFNFLQFADTIGDSVMFVWLIVTNGHMLF